MVPLSPLCRGHYRGTEMEATSGHSNSSKCGISGSDLVTVPTFLMLAEYKMNIKLYIKYRKF